MFVLVATVPVTPTEPPVMLELVATVPVTPTEPPVMLELVATVLDTVTGTVPLICAVRAVELESGHTAATKSDGSLEPFHCNV